MDVNQLNNKYDFLNLPVAAAEKIVKQPAHQIRWIHRDNLTANDYNPNSVAPPELDLLKISILEDGWTEALVVRPDLTEHGLHPIVDGFHRWTVSGDPEIYALTDGYLPVVFLREKSRADLQMATIRHNRARGTHGVDPMAEIVGELVRVEKLPMAEICERLGMEEEEVIRLANRKGIPQTEIVKNKGFSKAWRPK